MEICNGQNGDDMDIIIKMEKIVKMDEIVKTDKMDVMDAMKEIRQK